MDEPEIEDFEYDMLIHELIDIEEKYPELLTADSPTHRVGGKADSQFTPVEHTVPMESLQDAFSFEDVYAFGDEENDRSMLRSVGHPYVMRHARKSLLEEFADKVIADYGRVDYLINNAAPKMCGINNGSYEDFEYALKVGVTAPFYLSKLFAPHFAEGGSIVNISSSRDRMSQPNTESYTSAKGGISALTHALAVSFAGKVRVNSISPGWIDTNYTVYEGPDAVQQPAGRVGNPHDIANMVLYLCSDMAGFITGENVCIDGGMTRLMIYHGDHGWSLDE